MELFDKIAIKSELKFRTSRSSGPGGQSVNKVSTKVELLFDIWSSNILSDNQKETISIKLKNRINAEMILQMSSDETRSQLNNKVLVIERFISLLEETLKPIKKRKPTKPSRASKEKRLKTKKIKSDKKELRKPPGVV